MDMNKDKKRFGKLLSYAAGDMLGGAVGMVTSTYYFTFLLYVVGLNPYLAALVTGIGKVWDGIIDPGMGILVDRTKTKWGACRPYFLISVIPVFLSYFMLWYGWGISTVMGKFFYFSFAYIFYSSAISVATVPYESLLPRIVDSYEERTNFSSMRMIFSGIACVVSTYLYGIIITPANGTIISGLDVNDFRNLGLILGAGFSLPLLITFLGTKEKYAGNKTEKLTFKAVFKQYKQVMSSKIFRKYFYLGMCGVFIANSVIVPVVLLVMLLFNGDPTIVIVLPFALSFWVITIKGTAEMLFFPINVVLMKKKNKHFPLLIDIPLIMVSIIIVAFLSPSMSYPLLITLVLIAMVFLGAGTSCLGFVPMTLLPDLSDVDELMCGKRREGSSAGLTTMAKQIIGGLTITLFGLILGYFGLDTNVDSIGNATSGALTAVKIMFCVIPFFMCIIMILISRTYKLNAKTHGVVKDLIARKKEAGSIELSDEEIKICEELTGKDISSLWISQ
jgi:oligogalacturonide transporter